MGSHNSGYEIFTWFALSCFCYGKVQTEFTEFRHGYVTFQLHDLPSTNVAF